MERITVGALILLVAVVVVDRVVDLGGPRPPPPGEVAEAPGADGRSTAEGPDSSRLDTASAEAAVGTIEERAQPEGTPEILDLELERHSFTVPVGSEVSLRAAVGKEGRPRVGVPLVLDGSEALTPSGRRADAVTDSAGVAVFRLRAGDRPDTVRMRLLARGYWLEGDNRVTVRSTPSGSP